MLWPVTFSCCTIYLPQFIGQSLLDHTQQSRVGCSCKGTNIPTSLISPLIFPGTMCLINISTSSGKKILCLPVQFPFPEKKKVNDAVMRMSSL